MLVKKPEHRDDEKIAEYLYRDRDYHKARAEFAIAALQKEAEYDHIGGPINDAARALKQLKDNE